MEEAKEWPDKYEKGMKFERADGKIVEVLFFENGYGGGSHYIGTGSDDLHSYREKYMGSNGNDSLRLVRWIKPTSPYEIEPREKGNGVKWQKSDNEGNLRYAHIYDRLGFEIKRNVETNVYELLMLVYGENGFKIGDYSSERLAKEAAGRYLDNFNREVFIYRFKKHRHPCPHCEDIATC
jgi:hypothetical protein